MKLIFKSIAICLWIPGVSELIVRLMCESSFGKVIWSSLSSVLVMLDTSEVHWMIEKVFMDIEIIRILVVICLLAAARHRCHSVNLKATVSYLFN